MVSSVFTIPDDFIEPSTRELLSLLIRHSPAAIAVFDTHMRYIAASEKWVTDYRLARLDFKGVSHYEIFPEILGRPDWLDAHQRTLAGEILSCECERFVRADGHVEYVRWETRPWHSQTGEVGGMVMFTEVITGRVLEQQEIERQKQYMARAQSIAGVGYWRFDLRSKELYWSEEVFAIHGLDPLTHFPRIETALDAYHPEDSGIVENMIDRAIREKGAYDFRLRIVRPDGEARLVHSQGQCEFDKQGNVIAMFGVFKDITQEHGEELELRMVDLVDKAPLARSKKK